MPRTCSWKPSRPLSSCHGTVLGWAVLLATIPSSAVLAQDSLPPAATVAAGAEPLPQTHTVRKGDTLWDLAQHYLKDPFLWPGIFRQNTDVVEDPHWIYPGEVLRIAPVDNVAAVPTMDTPIPQPTSALADSAPAGDSTTASGNSDSTDALAQGPQQPSLAEESDQKPLFSSERPRTVAEILKAYTDQPYRPLRRSEFYSSGFLTEKQRLPYGRVLGPVTPQQIKAVNNRANALPFTTIAVEAPNGATYEVGDSLLILQLGREIEPFGEVVVPTGVARIIETVDEHYLATVVSTYGAIRNGQRVLPLESFSAGAGRRAVPVSDGVRGSLIGGLGRQELKEPQMVVFINKGRQDGVAPGDLFEVRRRPQRLQDGTIRVNELMATLQIVHVRDRTATAVVLNVISPDVPPGSDVLQVAKLPS
jgi:LysM repeat protein